MMTFTNVLSNMLSWQLLLLLSLSHQLIKALVPADPLDPSNVLLEVVSGRTTGGCKMLTFLKFSCIMYVFLHFFI